jgi:uncharacterized protein
VVMFVGPCVAGILLTAVVYGKAGLRDLGARSVKWRVAATWYAVALLTTPILATATLLALLPVSPEYLPAIFATEDKTSLLLMGAAMGLVVGVFEEIGWTGFAIPELRRRHGVFATGIGVGALWAGWHVLVYVWGSGDPSGTFSPALFLPEFLFLVGVLPVYRVLMVWVYDRTGSLLVAILMHAAHTASTTVLFVPSATGMSRVTYYVLLTIALWGFVGVVAAANRGQIARSGKPPTGIGSPQLPPR